MYNNIRSEPSFFLLRLAASSFSRALLTDAIFGAKVAYQGVGGCSSLTHARIGLAKTPKRAGRFSLEMLPLLAGRGL